MAATKYPRNLSAFTGLNPGRSRPDLDALASQVRESAIVIALDRIDYADDVCDLWFKDGLTSGDETILDGIVTAHDGEPLSSELVDDDGYPLITLSHARFESDGKQVVVPSPATHGWNTWFCGAGDDCDTPPAQGSGRGNGVPFRLTFSGPGDQYFDAQFREPVEMHDGEIFYSGTWSMDDTFDLSAYLPATVPASTPGAGNCNAVDQGGYSVFVPAGGDGSHTIDLDDPCSYCPVPTGGDEFWQYDKDTGIVSARPTGDGNCNLMNIPQEVYFMRKVPLGHPLGRFEIDTYKVEWIAPGWKLRLRCNKTSTGAGELAAWIMVFRRFNT